MSDSVARGEGDTRVVDTTNFNSTTRICTDSDNIHVIERFTRIDENTIIYRFTVDDPSTWEKQWTAEYPWLATKDLVFEYACHEGNYALGDILRGSRLLEKEAAEQVNTTRK